MTQERYDEKYNDYVIIMKDNVDINQKPDSYSEGDLVAYFIGDRSSTNRKIRRRYSGPWKIEARLRHNCLVIVNLLDGTRIATHVSMLKPYKDHYFTTWTDVLKTERSKLLSDIRKNKTNMSKIKKSKYLKKKTTKSEFENN